MIVHPGFRVARIAPQERPSQEAWVAAVRSFSPPQAGLLKEEGSTAVYRTTMLGRDVVAKRWELNSLASRLKALVHATRAFRHWRGAAWLSAHQIPTAACLVLLTEYRRGWPRQWLIMEALPGKTVLQHLADRDLSVPQEHTVAAALGKQAALLMHHRHTNRDPKPSNQIVTSVSDETATVALIDCVGIRRDIWFDSDEPIPMLARMLIEAIGVGLCPRRPLLMRALKSYSQCIAKLSAKVAKSRTLDRATRNHTWREISEFIQLHGDPTPRINPLSSPSQPAPR